MKLTMRQRIMLHRFQKEKISQTSNRREGMLANSKLVKFANSGDLQAPIVKREEENAPGYVV